jgi:predicted ATPase
MLLRALLLIERGRRAEGLELALRGESALDPRARSREQSHIDALAAQVYGKTGQIEKAIHLMDMALDRAQKTGERWYETELHRIKGELLLSQSFTAEEQAEACFQNALEVARGQSAKSLELRASMSLSRLWQRQGRQEDARKLLAEIYGWFTEGFDTADLKAAKALLEELS